MNDDESLPFDVEVERLPAWVHVSSAIVVIVAVLVATRLVHMLVLLPFLIASSIGRRFASSATHVEARADRLDLGAREIPRADVLDVWVDDDDADPRAVVAFTADVELAVLHFANREQARRFGQTFAQRHDAETRVLVAGYKPHLVDALASLRFVAIAAAFFGTGSPYGLFAVAFFGLGIWTLVRAKQLVARKDGFDIRTVLGTTTYAYADVESVDVEAGLIRSKSGATVDLPRSTLRDPTLASPAWLDRARTRVLEDIRERAAR